MCNYVTGWNLLPVLKIVTHTCASCVEIVLLLSTHVTSVLFLVFKFCPDYGLLLELHPLTQVARSHALLVKVIP